MGCRVPPDSRPSSPPCQAWKLHGPHVHEWCRLQANREPIHPPRTKEVPSFLQGQPPNSSNCNSVADNAFNAADSSNLPPSFRPIHFPRNFP